MNCIYSVAMFHIESGCVSRSDLFCLNETALDRTSFFVHNTVQS